MFFHLWIIMRMWKWHGVTLSYLTFPSLPFPSLPFLFPFPRYTRGCSLFIAPCVGVPSLPFPPCPAPPLPNIQNLVPFIDFRTQARKVLSHSLTRHTLTHTHSNTHAHAHTMSQEKNPRAHQYLFFFTPKDNLPSKSFKSLSVPCAALYSWCNAPCWLRRRRGESDQYFQIITDWIWKSYSCGGSGGVVGGEKVGVMGWLGETVYDTLDS